ncbi:hypothetical protein AAG906_003338 [Vitis piasezkii]
MRVDELVGSIQTYDMTLPNSQKLKDSAFKVFKNEEKYIEIPYDITHDELAHMAKRIKRKGKSSSKSKKVECFNYGGVEHYSQECPSPKNIKKSNSASTTSKDARYDPNDMLVFVASMNDFDCDNDSDSDSDDDEFIDEQRVEFFDNLVVEHERLIKSYIKNHEVLDAHKNKIDVLNAGKTNLLEKIRFLEFEHHSLLEKNNALTQEIKNNKPFSFRLGYFNKDETPSSGENVFVKAKSSSKWYFDSGCSKHMIGDKSSFTSFENYDSGVVTFRNGNLAKVRGKGSIAILGCPKLDKVLYVEELKASLLSISQIYDKDCEVNFHQDLCEVVNKEGKVVITRHRIVDNCYAIKPNSRTPLFLQ